MSDDTTNIYRLINDELMQGKMVVQATVIETKGSTPRKEGSTMLIRADNSLVGTVGGGCGEAGVIQKARLTLRDGKHREELADLTEDISLDTEAVCGGTVRVFIEPWHPNPQHKNLAQRLQALVTSDEPVTMHQIVGTEANGSDNTLLGKRCVINDKGETLLSELPTEVPLPVPSANKARRLHKQAGWFFYSERCEPIPTLVVIGAGHIAEPLEQFARQCGFYTVVVDDRQLFANRQRFPQATQVVCGPILEVCREITLSPQHCFVLVTRGHVLDMDALKVLIERNEPLSYLGMIGSRRRVRAVFELLEQQGYSRALFDHVYAPIGLNIGAESPAEIAISVLAEIIAICKGISVDKQSLSQSAHTRHPALQHNL